MKDRQNKQENEGNKKKKKGDIHVEDENVFNVRKLSDHVKDSELSSAIGFPPLYVSIIEWVLHKVMCVICLNVECVL